MPIKRLAAAALALLLLLTPVCAENAPEDSLAPRIEAFMESRGLTERSFSMCYYNTVTGEEYRFNDSAMMVAASTFKLPLNMYYYEMEAAGEIAPDAYIPRAGTSLAYCHEASLLWSDNDTAIGLLYNLGNFRTYKDCMRKYFTVTDEELDPKYYADNYYSTAMMMDALKYLYAHEADFTQLLDYLKQAQPEAYFKKYITDCPIAHKYGSFEGAENDVGIIYAAQPFLLAVFTQSIGEDISAQIARIAKEYTDEQHAKAVAAEEEARQKAEAQAEAEAKAAAVQAEAEAKAEAKIQAEILQKKKHTVLIAGSITVLCAAALVILLLKMRKKVKL